MKKKKKKKKKKYANCNVNNVNVGAKMEIPNILHTVSPEFGSIRCNKDWGQSIGDIPCCA